MQPGSRLGRYTIHSLIGRGGMGAVYRATDPTLGRDVALKVLPPELATDAQRIERFRREARALAALSHPNIVTIYSVEQDEDVHFLTMELVNGRPLDSVIDASGMSIERVTELGATVAGALAAAHEKGIVHRDLKPANIIVSDSGTTKVLDFGLSKIAPGAGTAEASMTKLATQVGAVVGTPAYMSPEQVSGHDVGPQSDIFSLGVILYELAVELDPSFAAAWAGLAEAFTVQGYMGMAPPGEVMPRALTAGRRAVALDPNLGEAHCALAAALMFWERDYDAARRAFVRGLELNPHYTQGRCWYGLFLLLWLYDAVPEGVREVRLAQENDPLSAYPCSILALGLARAGEMEEALRFARLATERDPDGFVFHWIHSLVAHWAGRFDEYFPASDRSGEVSYRHHFVMAHRAIACADCGRLAEARELHEELRARRAQGYVPYLSLAMSASAFGDMDAAVEYAQQACDEREPGLVIMTRVFPNLQRLREDHRFGDVLRRLAFPNLS